MINNQRLSQKNDIENFKQYFLKKYKTKVYVTPVKSLKNTLISLETFSICTLNALHNNECDCENITTLKNKSRKRPYISYIQIMTYMAFKQGHNKSNIGKYINRHHGTVINSIQQIENSFFTKELAIINMYNNIIKEIEIYVGNIPENLKEQVDTEPSSYTVWNETQDSLT
tara:strand:- start:2844 stop:3356 length:513 start_codon:yes stop_codon:yes gene_type:complete